MESKPRLLITGAAGFIGSSFMREALANNYEVTILDALTYAGHMQNIQDVLKEGTCDFVKGRIQDFELVDSILSARQNFVGVVNFAAESHVDNSISGPRVFIETNILGTFTLLEASRKYYKNLGEEEQKRFRFLHVSTDEVYGELGETGFFDEESKYLPNSPYSASKASSDHLVRAWYKTYGLPTITTNCSNNYGPRQFPEKLIPLMVTHALNDLSLPVYGRGTNIRDWIHVEDHCHGVRLAFERGKPGETYCFGGNSERNNITVVTKICELLDQLRPRSDGRSYKKQISYVQDRLGHDWRYAINDKKAVHELNFERRYKDFEDGLRHTILWYLENQAWIDSVLG